MQNLIKSFEQFSSFLSKAETEIELYGTVKSFTTCFEQACIAMREKLKIFGIETASPRDAILQAEKNKLVESSKDWLHFLFLIGQMREVYQDNLNDKIIIELPKFKKLVEKLISSLQKN